MADAVKKPPAKRRYAFTKLPKQMTTFLTQQRVAHIMSIVNGGEFEDETVGKKFAKEESTRLNKKYTKQIAVLAKMEDSIIKTGKKLQEGNFQLLELMREDKELGDHTHPKNDSLHIDDRYLCGSRYGDGNQKVSFPIKYTYNGKSKSDYFHSGHVRDLVEEEIGALQVAILLESDDVMVKEKVEGFVKAPFSNEDLEKRRRQF